MGLFFYTAGPVSPTEATLDQRFNAEKALRPNLDVMTGLMSYSQRQQAQRCVGENNQSYVCESGHCCEDLQCCSLFYELWWFWLMCAIIFIMTCCCVCRQRRVKHRLQQQQRQQEINLIAYREACNYTSPPFYFRFLPSYLLPDYEDVTSHPLTPPPPYCNSNAGAPACANNDEEEVQCESRQATPVPTASCSGPDVVVLENNSETQHRGDGRDRETMLKLDVDCRDQVRDEEMPGAEKDGPMERRRHFTGDSGIEVCLCSRGTESQRPRELEELLSSEGHGGSMEFCDGCGARHDKDNEQVMEPDVLTPPPPATPQLHPRCLYLHTINEQEGQQECHS